MSVQPSRDQGNPRPQRRPPEHLLHHAARLAYTCQTGNSLEIADAIHSVHPTELRPLLAVLAAMVDLDQPPRTRRLANTTPINLAHAHLQSLKPLWEAYQHGDRDPAITRAHHIYADYLLQTEGAYAERWAA